MEQQAQTAGCKRRYLLVSVQFGAWNMVRGAWW